MRRIPFLQLWLCALLSLQQPSVLVQAGLWQRCTQALEVEDPPRPTLVEKAELPGLRSGSLERWTAAAARRWRMQPRHEPRPARRVAAVLPSHETHTALARWRAALMPPRVPPDDEQRMG
ncbi:hypothetical protein [Cystobacter ferrugineus]|uniref:Uncharacterized protein n=1 Tax=Cystobacter ferrugineus TaxID=83449 RepID=A0A1L9B094_9BACT|nr:hypothetical protein [Cystobacter ferrugineus]OJH35679.1 hypothetical protein BON30_37055 [Cystobacter ferrugineus]